MFQSDHVYAYVNHGGPTGASHQALGRFTAERSRNRIERACAEAAHAFTTRRHIGLYHPEASDVLVFPSPVGPGHFIEIALEISEAGQCWAVRIARLTPAPGRSMRRRELASVTYDDGETDTYIREPLPGALVAALPKMLAAVVCGGLPTQAQ